jgi:hypothetical protein
VRASRGLCRTARRSADEIGRVTSSWCVADCVGSIVGQMMGI